MDVVIMEAGVVAILQTDYGHIFSRPVHEYYNVYNTHFRLVVCCKYDFLRYSLVISTLCVGAKRSFRRI